MSRGWGYALLTLLADVLITAGSAHHFTGLTVLLIIVANVGLLLMFLAPHVAEARRKMNAAHQATGRAAADIDEEHRIRHAASVLERGQS